MKRLPDAGKLAPASVDLKIPCPLTAAKMIEEDWVSSFKSRMNDPIKNAPPSLKSGAFVPKLAPPSTDRYSPALVATNSTSRAGTMILLIATPLKMLPGFRTVHVSPASVDPQTRLRLPKQEGAATKMKSKTHSPLAHGTGTARCISYLE